MSLPGLRLRSADCGLRSGRLRLRGDTHAGLRITSVVMRHQGGPRGLEEKMIYTFEWFCARFVDFNNFSLLIES